MQTLSAGSVSLLSMAPTLAADTERDTDPWNAAQTIIDRVRKPIEFRKQDFLITAYGAASCALVPTTAWISFVEKANVMTPVAGSKDCYPAIDAAIDEALKKALAESSPDQPTTEPPPAE